MPWAYCSMSWSRGKSHLEVVIPWLCIGNIYWSSQLALLSTTRHFLFLLNESSCARWKRTHTSASRRLRHWLKAIVRHSRFQTNLLLFLSWHEPPDSHPNHPTLLLSR